MLEGFTQTQISTIAVKDRFVIAGGFQGEIICKVNITLSLSLPPIFGFKKSEETESCVFKEHMREDKLISALILD